MNKEQILLDELNKVGNFTTVIQEFNNDQLGVIYGCMDTVKLLNLPSINNCDHDWQAVFYFGQHVCDYCPSCGEIRSCC